MNCPHCSHALDLKLIPEELFQSENGRRRSIRRKTFSGGPGGTRTWGKHNPTAKNCRCKKCNTRREAA